MARVLIVETNSSHLEGLKQVLKSVDIEVESKPCVASALLFARQNLISLFLVSDTLPGLSATDFLELRKLDPYLKEVPAIVLGLSSASKLECFRLGCDDFIELPADEHEILFRIVAALRRNHSAGLSGSIETIGLVEVIQLISSARQTGRLDVESAETSGQLFFEAGQVVQALNGVIDGIDAVLQILQAARYQGSYRFTAGPLVSHSTRIDKRTDHLLLELANRLDEGHSR